MAVWERLKRYPTVKVCGAGGGKKKTKSRNGKKNRKPTRSLVDDVFFSDNGAKGERKFDGSGDGGKEQLRGATGWVRIHEGYWTRVGGGGGDGVCRRFRHERANTSGARASRRGDASPAPWRRWRASRAKNTPLAIVPYCPPQPAQRRLGRNSFYFLTIRIVNNNIIIIVIVIVIVIDIVIITQQYLEIFTFGPVTTSWVVPSIWFRCVFFHTNFVRSVLIRWDAHYLDI